MGSLRTDRNRSIRSDSRKPKCGGERNESIQEEMNSEQLAMKNQQNVLLNKQQEMEVLLQQNGLSDEVQQGESAKEREEQLDEEIVKEDGQRGRRNL